VNWNGTCKALSSITRLTFVIVGTDDVVTPVANSLMIVEQIPAAWLVKMKGGGHGLMYQYPEQFSKIVEIFLANTKTL
jgi:pimeloyl-ACP methyl ester carboxylesterase